MGQSAALVIGEFEVDVVMWIGRLNHPNEAGRLREDLQTTVTSGMYNECAISRLVREKKSCI
jgi:hypothetical protein